MKKRDIEKKEEDRKTNKLSKIERGRIDRRQKEEERRKKDRSKKIWVKERDMGKVSKENYRENDKIRSLEIVNRKGKDNRIGKWELNGLNLNDLLKREVKGTNSFEGINKYIEVDRQNGARLAYPEEHPRERDSNCLRGSLTSKL